jgi:hypothetical protein
LTPAAGTGRCAARRPWRAPAAGVQGVPRRTPSNAEALPWPTYSSGLSRQERYWVPRFLWLGVTWYVFRLAILVAHHKRAHSFVHSTSVFLAFFLPPAA